LLLFHFEHIVFNSDIVMNSILLTGLFQRLLIALFALAAVWGMYFWAVA
jgi:putative transport protein